MSLSYPSGQTRIGAVQAWVKISYNQIPSAGLSETHTQMTCDSSSYWLKQATHKVLKTYITGEF